MEELEFFTERLLADLNQTHAHVIGSSGQGKSKFLEWLARELFYRRLPFAIFDWHGTLAQAIIQHIASLPYPRPLVILQPRNQNWVLPYNPFIPPEGMDKSEHVTYAITALTRPWGVASTDSTPQIERGCRMLFRFCADLPATLPNAADLLHGNPEHCQFAAYVTRADPASSKEWRDLAESKTPRGETDSTRRKLQRFISHEVINRHITYLSGNLSVAGLLTRQIPFIADFSGMPTDEARVFASMLLWDFFRTAIRQPGKFPVYYMILDEFQHFLTKDVADSFPEARKAGLRLIAAHQQFGQLQDAVGLEESIATNAQCSVVFGELNTPAARTWAEERMLDHIERIPAGNAFENYRSREDRVYKVAYDLKSTAKQTCWVKLRGESAFQWEVPTVEDSRPTANALYLFLRTCRAFAGVKTKEEADTELRESARQFQATLNSVTFRKKKKSPPPNKGGAPSKSEPRIPKSSRNN